ncbi:MAG: hypothetical protein MUC29_15040 [Pyrinomonadaceae bacterium]|nr:hypothetical protein [Pyrinomonadaceae bacterium]
MLLVWLMFVAIQVSAQTTSTTPKTSQKVENEIVINKKPLKDFGKFVLEQLKQNKINLDSPFSLKFTTKLNNGKFDRYETKFVDAQGDSDLIEVIIQGISGINDSGYLKYLEQLNGKNGIVIILQNDVNLSVSLKFQVESESEARKLASAFKLLIAVAKIKSKEVDAKKNDDFILLENSSVLSEGKDFVINFILPRSVAKEMIDQKLDELRKENY